MRMMMRADAVEASILPMRPKLYSLQCVCCKQFGYEIGFRDGYEVPISHTETDRHALIITQTTNCAILHLCPCKTKQMVARSHS